MIRIRNFRRKICGVIVAISIALLASCGGSSAVTDIYLETPEIEVGEVYEFEAELVEIMNLNLRYILTYWWSEDKIYVFDRTSSYLYHEEPTEEEMEEIQKSTDTFVNWQENDYLYIAISQKENSDENAIRPISHAVYSIASALKFGYYDEDVVGVTEEDAKDMSIRLISSVAKVYKANDENGWGEEWQSPLWAQNIGFAAWLLWDDIPEDDRVYITNMITAEANFVLKDYEIPYYMDVEGNIVYEGDTKSEEIAWTSKILALASNMLPDEKNNSEWEEKLLRMLIAATSAPGDVGSYEVVDGIVIGEFLEGSNINSDGTVINHGRYHIDYMTTIYQEMAETIVVYRLAGKEVPEAATFNLDLMYNALINVDLGLYDSSVDGRYFYERDSEENPTGEITMPGDNDWGMSWYANCYLTDVTAHVMGLDEEIDEQYKALVWAKLHLEKVQEQIYRENEDGEITGQFFQYNENNFVSGELFQAHNLVEAYILMNY
jgi:hypothetical protein